MLAAIHSEQVCSATARAVGDFGSSHVTERLLGLPPPVGAKPAGSGRNGRALERVCCALPALIGMMLSAVAWAVDSGATGSTVPDGRAIFEARCAACHGSDGKGAPGRAALKIAMPDFSDCSFASREPDGDWRAVAHDGGPARGFSELMPAHGKLLSEAEIAAVVKHLRSFCSDRRWPRGELNLPRPLVTEKAFPEDEALITTFANVNRDGEVATDLLFEKRIGPRAMLEIALPVVAVEQRSATSSHWNAGVGDVGLGAKYAFFHSLESGSIASLGGELKIPTGDEDRGLGQGTVVFEPYLAAGQRLPWNSFAQLQLLGEIPTERDMADEIQLRLALGNAFSLRPHGRVLAPMVEMIGAWKLGDESETDWDIVPQIQVPLSRRQHIRVDLGVRIPLTNTDERATRFGAYLLWDWFDGGLLDGW